MWNMTNNVTASKLRLNRENKSFAFLIPEPKVMFYCIMIFLVNYDTSFVLKNYTTVLEVQNFTCYQVP